MTDTAPNTRPGGSRRPKIVTLLVGAALLAAVMLLAHLLGATRAEYRDRIRYRRRAEERVKSLLLKGENTKHEIRNPKED